MSRLQTLNDRISERFIGKDYYCEMPSKTRYSDWPCDAKGVGDQVDCGTCPLNTEQSYKAFLEFLCLESAQ